MTQTFLPYGRQVIEDDDVAAVVRTLRAEMLTTGPEVPAFEEEFASTVGARFAVACANGTAGLHLAALAAGVGTGDVAIVPSITFLATANAIALAGGRVVFADVDPESGLMTAEALADALERCATDPKLVLPVHLGGQTCDMAALASVAARRGARLVEDACHALGTADAEGAIRVGDCRHSLMAVFSLHPVKTITAGEGGVVTTNDPDVANRLRLLRSHGMIRDPLGFTVDDLARDAKGGVNPWYYEMPEPGLNYRLTDIQAALARSQLAKLARFAEARRSLAAAYDSLLAPLAPLVRPVARRDATRPVLHLYQVLIDFAATGVSRAEVIFRLKSRGIGTQVHYIPVHRQPYFSAQPTHVDLPGADAFYARTLSLPLFPGMQAGDAERVVAALASAISS
jgi:UDP-4-amino-4,6-dideoxy-N-acetyl-beta-L-altrosamine transaminase